MDTFDQAHSDIKANELLAFAQEELPPPPPRLQRDLATKPPLEVLRGKAH